jgi:CheY-like chemotaxis protein
MFRQHFRRDLRSGRFIMEFALSAAAALERIKAIADPSLILILSDINMPGMSGLEMLPRVRAFAHSFKTSPILCKRIAEAEESYSLIASVGKQACGLK